MNRRTASSEHGKRVLEKIGDIHARQRGGRKSTSKRGTVISAENRRRRNNSALRKAEADRDLRLRRGGSW